MLFLLRVESLFLTLLCVCVCCLLDEYCKRRIVDGKDGRVLFLGLGFDRNGSNGMRVIMPKRVIVKHPLLLLKSLDDRLLKIKLIPPKFTKK